jgi:hypothetical protein
MGHLNVPQVDQKDRHEERAVRDDDESLHKYLGREAPVCKVRDGILSTISRGQFAVGRIRCTQVCCSD